MKREYKFKKCNGEIIPDVKKYVNNWIKENPYGTITIGCDSQEHARYIKYSASIVMHYKDKWGGGHGGHVISANYIDYSKNMKMDIYTKLFAESEIVVEVAQMLGNINKKPTIHLDYNSDENQYSHVLAAAGMGYVKSMGFDVRIKPDAWAASHTADKFAKSGRK